MGMSTVFAVHTHNGKRENFISKLNAASVRAITYEAAGVSAGRRNKVQIKRRDCFIVKILRNKVVVFCFNCYHKYAWI